MQKNSLQRLLAELETLKTSFALPDAVQVEGLLCKLGRRDLPDAASLIRLHELLLFLRAFPHSPGVLRICEQMLNQFVQNVERLRTAGADLSPLEPLEVSGISGTVIEDALSYDVVRWLARRFPKNLEIVWNGYEQERLMANTWPRFIPLLQEDAYVEANIPWLVWLRAARGNQFDIHWLLRRFENLSLPSARKSELYDGLQMVVRWNIENLRASRTRNWRRPKKIYYHKEPLLHRRDVSLAEEFAKPPLSIRRLSVRKGEVLLDLVREVMAVRYRELHGTTHGDPRQVFRAKPGRGVEIFVWGLPPERRLPLRAYLAGITLKNGVPINYIEAISLFEWTEIGFNTFYTFRDGETAWIYAQALRFIRQLHQVRCLSVYPYQLGLNNEEAIDSGAFWFYRKLGFRPNRATLQQLTEAEERKLAKHPTHRTPRAILKKLARGHIFYELPNAEFGAWDRFSVRNIGLAVNLRMAREFDGNPERIRSSSVAQVLATIANSARDRRLLSRSVRSQKKFFEDFALVLALIPDLARWSSEEKHALVNVICAKTGGDELGYLGLLQQHRRLRRAVLTLGSGE